MRQAKFVVALAAAASACPLHDLADALEKGRAPRFGAPRAEREELLSVDGSAPTSPV